MMAKRRKRKRPKPAANPTARPEDDDLSLILLHIKEQKSSIEKLAAKKPRDVWGKLEVFGSLISSVLIASVGLLFTYMYQSAQDKDRRLLREQQDRHEIERSKVRELELVAKLLPQLGSSDESVRKQSFLTIKALGNANLMAQLALNDPSDGARAALQAVALSPQSTAEDRATATQALEQIREWDAAIVASASDAVVRVSARRDGSHRHGSGFVWSSSDRIVTCLHVVIGGGDIRVTTRDRAYEATVERVHVDANLALLRVKEPLDAIPLPTSDFNQTVGERLLIIGCPETHVTRGNWMQLSPTSSQLLYALLPHQVLQRIKIIGFPSIEMRVIPLSGGASAGLSGAPALNIDGKVIGIFVGGVPDFSWAIPSDQLHILQESTEEMPQPPQISDFFW